MTAVTTSPQYWKVLKGWKAFKFSGTVLKEKKCNFSLMSENHYIPLLIDFRDPIILEKEWTLMHLRPATVIPCSGSSLSSKWPDDFSSKS